MATVRTLVVYELSLRGAELVPSCSLACCSPGRKSSAYSEPKLPRTGAQAPAPEGTDGVLRSWSKSLASSIS